MAGLRDTVFTPDTGATWLSTDVLGTIQAYSQCPWDSQTLSNTTKPIVNGICRPLDP
jgi:hypothetical protein